MRGLGVLAAVVALAGAPGCTHHSLTRNTVLTTTTVMDIQYTSVLANLAMMSAHPEALPNHVHLADGVVQINDRLGFGQGGGFYTVSSNSFGLNQFGPSGQRQVTEQWGTDATTDPERLFGLQSLYRAALGLPPLPPPNGIEYLRLQRGERAEGKSGKGPQKDDQRKQEKQSGSSGGVSPAAAQSGTTSPGGGGSTPGGGSSSGSGDDSRRVPIDVLLTDVPPPGWYGVGCKKDVPKDACYVGRWRDRYAWVTADGVPYLARFTITALSVIKLKPGDDSGGKHGLAVTSGN
jgi:hypothetical protein